MAYRVKHLVTQMQVPPTKICILMFNRNARVQFRDRLYEIGLEEGRQPRVNTFHSFAYQLIEFMRGQQILPGTLQVWAEEDTEQLRRTVHKAIGNVIKQEEMPGEVDVDEVMEAISLWKASLIPPQRAGYNGNWLVPLVYKEFEQLRNSVPAITYDDFVPVAVGGLENYAHIATEWASYDYVIVDEYQDVNYGQQRLIELLAGRRADVMVVGDDDQTIYEWRGARSNYILRTFREVFDNKPHVDYTLSHSFRFGPTIAQCAQNVISFNQNRIAKPLIAFNVAQEGGIRYIQDVSNQKRDASRELAALTVDLVRHLASKQPPRPPKEIVVLGRMYSQLDRIEVEYLTSKIPYKIIGRAPFFERREIQALLDYLRLALALDEPLNDDAEKLLLSVANTPNRRLNKETLRRTCRSAGSQRHSPRFVLDYLGTSFGSTYSTPQKERVQDLLAVLNRLGQLLAHGYEEPPFLAGDILRWLIENTDYLKHFDNYYGSGEASEDRKRSVRALCDYAATTGLSARDFLDHLLTLDTTRGQPDELLIRLTTVFRTKGDEFDYVIIPSCEEGYMPCLFGTPDLTYDTSGKVEEPPASAIIENERRLFYVAVTRAREGVYIEASCPPSKGSQTKAAETLPSRFIYEMQLERTSAVMDAVRACAVHEAGAKRRLGNAILEHAEVKPVMANVIRYYLPALGLGADSEIAQRKVDKVPAKVFAYPHQYRLPDLLGGPVLGMQARPAAPAPANDAKETKWWEAGDFPF